MYSNTNQMRELQRRQVFDITDWCISIHIPWLAQLLLCITAKNFLFNIAFFLESNFESLLNFITVAQCFY